MTPADDDKGMSSVVVVEISGEEERTVRLPSEVLNLLSTWHELRIYIELSTPPSDQMAVLHIQMLRSVGQHNMTTSII